LLTDFFVHDCKQGWPVGGTTVNQCAKRGPLPKDTNIKQPAVPETAITPKACNMIVAKRKFIQTNWGSGEGLQCMLQAKSDYLSKEGTALEDNGEPYPLKVYANIIGIPYDMLCRYVAGDSCKQHATGQSVGKPALLSVNDQHFAVDVLARRDHGNNGATMKEAIDIIQDISDGTIKTRVSAHRHFSRTITKNFKHIIKQKPVVAQATTMKQCAITVDQQFRWHQTYKMALNKL